MQTKRYWLDAPQGRVLIGATKVLIGRSADCTIVLEGAQVSRYHVMLRLGEQGPELLPLGREPVLINGVERRSLTALAAGDAIELCGWSFRVGEGDADPGPAPGKVAWFLERQTGLLHFVSGPSFRVGGGDDDDLIFIDWEHAVLTLDASAGPPVLCALRPGVWCERPLAPGERVTLATGAHVAYRGETLTVRAKQVVTAGDTEPSTEKNAARRVELEFLPRGGQLTIEVGGRTLSTRLSDRRCDLMALLLRPPAPFVAGELIPEEVITARIWPGEENGRTELNSLLYRLRRVLDDQGVDAAPLFERLGGGLRFRLAPGAVVLVR
ncbi:MAG: Inner rane component of cytoplasmic domain [Myxococcaceae bacterium]|nr:Inner rane component of cytoplasmic domain [Myxococcaceae bacterium]